MASVQILKKPKKKKSILLRIAFLVVFAYVLVVFVNQQITISKKRAQYAELSSKLSAQKLENETLKSLSNGENKTAYIERIARETLNYVYPGETIYVDLAHD